MGGGTNVGVKVLAEWQLATHGGIRNTWLACIFLPFSDGCGRCQRIRPAGDRSSSNSWGDRNGMLYTWGGGGRGRDLQLAAPGGRVAVYLRVGVGEEVGGGGDRQVSVSWWWYVWVAVEVGVTDS